MGLDMWLTTNSEPLARAIRDRDIKRAERIDNEHIKQAHIDLTNSRYSDSVVITWRKANMIHNWFDDKSYEGIGNCEVIEVPIEWLEELLNDINTVLDNPGRAEELIPTSSGFFFGSTEYGESYLYDLEFTKNELEYILGIIKDGVHPEQPDWNVKFFYEAWW